MNKKTFLALFAVAFVAQIGIGIVAPLMPLYAESMGASGLALGIMFSGYAVARIIAMPIAGRLSDVRGRKRFIAIGLLAYTIISLLYIWAPNIVALTFVRFFHGLASSTAMPIASAYVGDLTPKGKEGTYINLFMMSEFLGMGFGPVLGGVLTQLFYIGAAFYAMTVLSGLALLLLIRFVPATAPRSRADSELGVAPLRTMVRDRRIQASSIFRFSRGLWRQGIVAFLPLLAISALGMTPASIGLVLSIYMLAEAGLQGLAGPFVDRSNKLIVIAICSTIGAAPLLLIPYVRSMSTLLATLLIVALLTAVGRATTQAINVEAGKQHRGMGTVMGIYSGAGSLGQMTGPVALGYTMDVLGLNSVFILAAAMGIVGGLATIYPLAKMRQDNRLLL